MTFHNSRGVKVVLNKLFSSIANTFSCNSPLSDEVVVVVVDVDVVVVVVVIDVDVVSVTSQSKENIIWIGFITSPFQRTTRYPTKYEDFW